MRLFLVPAAFSGWRQWRAPAQRFLIARLLPAWIFCELMPTKLPHYVLPLYPALALLAGGMLQSLPHPLTEHVWRLGDIVMVLWGAISITFAAAPVALPMLLGVGVSISEIIAGVVLLGLALVLLGRRRPLLAAAPVGLLAAGFALPAPGVVVSALDLLWLSRSSAMVVARHQPRQEEAVLSVGYREPSFVFLLGTATRLVTAAPADQQLAGACIALVSDRDDAAFQRSLESRGLLPLAIDRVSGLDYWRVEAV